MNSGSVIFNNNEGIGGFEQGLYDNNAIQPTDNNWTRQSCFSLPEKSRLLWKISRKNAYFISSCAVGKNKTIIVPECDGKLFSEEGRLIEIDEHGTIKELFRCKSKLHRPVIGMDGLLYITTFGAVNSKGNRLFCLFPDGTVKWEFLINDCAYSSSVIDGQGNIYIFTYGDKTGTLISISKDGTLNWNYKFSSVNWCDPVISKAGVIYIGLNVSKTLCAFNKRGEMLWEKLIGQGLGTEFMNLKEDGTIYVSLLGTLYALYPDGNVKWTYKSGTSNVMEAPAIDKNGRLYLNRTPYYLVSLDSMGSELWKVDIKNSPLHSPIVGRDGRIIQTSYLPDFQHEKSYIIVISPEGKMLWEYEVDGVIMAAYITDDNMIYVLTNVINKNGKWEIHVLGEVTTDME